MDNPTAKRKVTAKIDYASSIRPSPSHGSFASPAARANTTPTLPRARVKVIADASPSVRPLVTRSPSVASFDGGGSTRSGPSTPSNVGMGVRQAMARAATAPGPLSRSVVGQSTPGSSVANVRAAMDRSSPVARQMTPRTSAAVTSTATPSSRPFSRTLSASSANSRRGDDRLLAKSPEPYSSFSSSVSTAQASTSTSASQAQFSTPLSRLQRQMPIEDPPTPATAFVSPRSPAREASRRARRIVRGGAGAGAGDHDDRPSSPTRSEASSSRGSELGGAAGSSRSSAVSRDDQVASSAASGSGSKGTRTPQTSLGSSQGPGQGRSDGEDAYHPAKESLEEGEAREAKRDRKIADLEISNQSLMTINKALEAAAARKDRLISSLKRQLRASGQAPVSYFDLRTTGAGEDDDDAIGDESNEEDEEEDLAQRSRLVDDSLTKLNVALEDMVKRGRDALKRVEETKEGERGKVLNALDLEEATSYDDEESPQARTPVMDAEEDS